MMMVITGKSGRPPRPMLQLAVPANQLEASHGQVTRIKMMVMTMVNRIKMMVMTMVTRIKMMVMMMVNRIKIKQIEMITLAKLTLASNSKI